MNWKGVEGSSHRVILCNCSSIFMVGLGKTVINEKKRMENRGMQEAC